MSRQVSDRDIIERMRRGDPSGLRDLLDLRGSRVLAWLARMHGLHSNSDIVINSVTDAAMIMYERARRLDTEGNLRGYLTVTARRLLAKQLKRRKDAAEQAADVPLDLLPAKAEREPDGPFIRALRAFMAGLPEREREILELDGATDFQMSAQQIAEQLGTSRETVYSMRNRTKGKLAAFQEKWHVDGRPGGAGGDR